MEKTTIPVVVNNAELEDMKKDNDRLQKRVTRLTEQLEEEKKKTPAVTSSSSSTAELEDLQRDKARLEKKVERLTKRS